MGSFFNGGSRNKPRYERLPLDTFYPTDATQITRREDPDEDNLLFDLEEPGSQNGRLLPSMKHSYDSEEEIEFYKDTRRSHHRRPGQCCGTTRCCLLCLLLVLVIVVVFFSAMYLVGPRVRTPSLNSSKNVNDWTSSTFEYATETAIRLYDVNLDGVQDVILGAGSSTSIEDIENEVEFCKKIHMEFPCAGLILAFDGRNGTRLWTIRTRVEVFAIQCGKLDINGDGHMDCIAAGRMGTLHGIDPVKGVILWSGDQKVTNPHFNFYQGQVVPDLDQDSVPDYVVTHGGDTRFKEEEVNRPAGRLILLSGKTGKSLGRFLTLPDGHETYSSITLYKRQNGAIYLLFGSGGETIAGSLWMISLRNLYCYVTYSQPCLANHLSHVPPLLSKGYDEPWGTPIQTLPSSVMEIIKSGSSKGLTVPTELVDMNNDGIDDLVVFMYNSTIVVLNGVNLQVIWSTGTKFAKFETYSNPAPGYFNDDDTIDLMVRLSEGKWPKFTSTVIHILDGRNGEILWSLKIPSESAVMSSPLTIQSSGRKDAFLFWVQGLDGKIGENGEMGLGPVGHAVGSEDHVALGSATSTVPPRRRRHGEEEARKEQCQMSMNVLRAQLLLLDRDLAQNPLQVASIDAFRYNYALTEEDRLHLKEDSHPEPGAMVTESRDSPVIISSQSSVSITNTQPPVTEEDLARHNLHKHSTAATHVNTVTIPGQTEPTTDADTMPQGPVPTTYADTVPEGSKPTTDSDKMPESPEPTTDADTMPQGPEPTTYADTVPEGSEQTTDSDKMPESPEPTTDADTVPEGSEPTTDSDKMPESPEPTTDADTMPEGLGSTINTVTASEEPEPSTHAVTVPVGQNSSAVINTSEIVKATTSKSTDFLETSTPATTSFQNDSETSSVQPTSEKFSRSTEIITSVGMDSETIMPTADMTQETTIETGMSQTSEMLPTLTAEITTESNLQQTTAVVDLEMTVESSQTTVELQDAKETTTNSALVTDDMHTNTSQSVSDISQILPSTISLTVTEMVTIQTDGTTTPNSNEERGTEADFTSSTGHNKSHSDKLTQTAKGESDKPEMTSPPNMTDGKPSSYSTEQDGTSTVAESSADQNIEGTSRPPDQTGSDPDDGEPRRKRETPGGDLCMVYQPNLFGTGIIGDLDHDGNLDYIYAEAHMGRLLDEGSSFISSKIRLRIHRVDINSAIKRRDLVTLADDQVTLSDKVTVSKVEREEIVDHFQFLPADKQSWTAYMGRDVDGKFKKNER